MVTNRTFLIVFVILTMALSACASTGGAVQPPATEPLDTEPATTPESTSIEELSTTPIAVSHGNEVRGYVELVDALRAAGATVELAGEVEQAFFSVKGQKVQVNGAEVQVFEYSDEAARQAESDLISPDGISIGTSMITWVDQPNFWAKGNLIVLYLGKDPAIFSLFNPVLGDPLTQHP